MEDIRLSLKYYFTYNKIENVKYGMCSLCGQDPKGNFKTSIKMKNSNTSGLKSHLKRHHKKEFDQLFPIDTSSKKSVLPKSQPTLDSVLKVSAFESFYSYFFFMHTFFRSLCKQSR